MKRLLASAVVVAVLRIASFARAPATQIDGKRVFKNDDVVFHRIDEHTRVGSGHIMASESLYLVEGNDKAVLIDAGTRITDLDTIVASLTKKRVMRVVTHAHPDHTGSAINDSAGLYSVTARTDPYKPGRIGPRSASGSARAGQPAPSPRWTSSPPTRA